MWRVAYREAGVGVGRQVRKHCKNLGKKKWREVEIKLNKLADRCGKEREVKMQYIPAGFFGRGGEIKRLTLD